MTNSSPPKGVAFRIGIRQKMLAILLAVLTLSIGISSWFTLQKQEKDIYDAINLRGEEIVKHASRAIALYAISYDYHSIQLLLDEVVNSKDIIHAHVTSPKGNIMAIAGPGASEGEQRPTFSKSIVFDDKPVGELTIELDPRDIVGRVEESRNALLLREFILIVLVALGEFTALSFIIARPVAIINGSLSSGVDEHGLIFKEISIKSRDEFGQLASQFNLMRDQLNAAHAKLQSRIEVADKRLMESNNILIEQSKELKAMNQRLMELSITDELTKLFNRRHFEEILDKELSYSARHQEPFSLLILDIDHFKKFNDNFGHATGDYVLRQLSDIIRDNVRKSDIACRIGGEEFAIACRSTTGDDARQLGERLRSAAENAELMHLENRLNITISVGIETVTSEDDKSSPDNICSRADSALYESKRTGRNRITHHEDLDFSGTPT